MQMLEPFLKFVLLDPKVTVSQLIRQQLLTGLLLTASSLVKCPGMLQSTLCDKYCQQYNAILQLVQRAVLENIHIHPS